jgi:hypothetical protein
MKTTVANSLNGSGSFSNYFHIYRLLYKLYVEVSRHCRIFKLLGHWTILTTGHAANVSLAHSLA